MPLATSAHATPPNQRGTDSGATATANDAETAQNADSPINFERQAGATRFQTAAEIATARFTASTDVVIATGEDFADALAGAGLEGTLEAPVLLVPSDLINGSIPSAITNAIDDLGATSATLLGGTNAISTDVENFIENNSTVTTSDRVSGSTRFETAEEIASRVSASPLPTQLADDLGLGGGDTAFLATGLEFADALAAGPGAYEGPRPTLLTPTNDLHPAAERGLTDSGADNVIILGGNAAVSSSVESELQTLGFDTARLAGSDRWETATEVADAFADGLGFGVADVGLATGFNFADALASAPYLGELPAPLVLTPSNSVNDQPLSWFEARACDIETIHVFGGQVAVEDAVAEGYAEAACPEPTVDEGIAGTVTNAETGDPIEGADVVATNSETFTATTDADGNYILEATPDSYTVTADAAGFQEATETGVEVTAGNVTTVDFALASGEVQDFSVDLSWVNEVDDETDPDDPQFFQGEPEATGLADLSVVEGSEGGSRIETDLSWEGVTPPFDGAAGAHIHSGAFDENGPVEIFLATPDELQDAAENGTGSLSTTADELAGSSTFDSIDDLAGAIHDNPENFYVNVHSDDFPVGVIRGQLPDGGGDTVMDSLDLNAAISPEEGGPGTEATATLTGDDLDQIEGVSDQATFTVAGECIDEQTIDLTFDGTEATGTFTIPGDAGEGECTLTFELTVNPSTTFTATFTVLGTNQTFDVTPDDAENNPTDGSRDYTVTGFGEDTNEVVVELADADNVSGDAIVTFATDEDNGDFTANFGTTAATIVDVTVDGTTFPGVSAGGTVEVDADSTVEFTVQGQGTDETVTPVVYDGDENGDLPTDADGDPLNDFGVGGDKTFVDVAVDLQLEPDVGAAPDSALNPFATEHEITATLVDSGGDPVDLEGQEIEFEVLRYEFEDGTTTVTQARTARDAARGDAIGTNPANDVAFTETVEVVDGQAVLTYTGPDAPPDGAPEDEASVFDAINIEWNGSGSYDGESATGDSAKDWSAEDPVPTTFDVEPVASINLADTDHTVSATIEDQFGDPVDDAIDVDFTVNRTGVTGAVATGTRTTDGGTATFTYNGPADSAEDQITATADSDDLEAAGVPAGTDDTTDPPESESTGWTDTVDKDWAADADADADDAQVLGANIDTDWIFTEDTPADAYDYGTGELYFFNGDEVSAAEWEDEVADRLDDDDLADQAMFLNTYGYADSGATTIFSLYEDDGDAAAELEPGVVDSVVASADPDSLPGGGGETSTITATVEDAFGQPIEGETVSFNDDGVNNVSDGGTADTDANGEAQVTYTTDANDDGNTVTVTATADSVSDTATIDVGSAATITQANNIDSTNETDHTVAGVGDPNAQIELVWEDAAGDTVVITTNVDGNGDWTDSADVSGLDDGDVDITATQDSDGTTDTVTVTKDTVGPTVDNVTTTQAGTFEAGTASETNSDVTFTAENIGNIGTTVVSTDNGTDPITVTDDAANDTVTIEYDATTAAHTNLEIVNAVNNQSGLVTASTGNDGNAYTQATDVVLANGADIILEVAWDENVTLNDHTLFDLTSGGSTASATTGTASTNVTTVEWNDVPLDPVTVSTAGEELEIGAGAVTGDASSADNVLINLTHNGNDDWS